MKLINILISFIFLLNILLSYRIFLYEYNNTIPCNCTSEKPNAVFYDDYYDLVQYANSSSLGIVQAISVSN